MAAEKQLIYADELRAKFPGNHTRWHFTGIWAVIDCQPTVDAIPIAVIKRAIDGIKLADQCDQAGRWDYELRDALQTVMKWYGSPSYKEHERRTKQ